MKIAKNPPMGWNSWDCYSHGARLVKLSKRSN